jgi:hypothetical protein
MVDNKGILHPKNIQRTFTISFKKLTFFTFLLQIYSVVLHHFQHYPSHVNVFFFIFQTLSLSKFVDVPNILSNKLKMLKGPLAFSKAPRVLTIYLVLPTWCLMLLECCSTLLNSLWAKLECFLPITCHFEHFFI